MRGGEKRGREKMGRGLKEGEKDYCRKKARKREMEQSREKRGELSRAKPPSWRWGLPYMTSSKFSDFGPPPPLSHTKFMQPRSLHLLFGGPPTQCGRHLWKPPCVACAKVRNSRESFFKCRSKRVAKDRHTCRMNVRVWKWSRVRVSSERLRFIDLLHYCIIPSLYRIFALYGPHD